MLTSVYVAHAWKLNKCISFVCVIVCPRLKVQLIFAYDSTAR